MSSCLPHIVSNIAVYIYMYNIIILMVFKDFFYVCPTHLKDRNFCSPIMDAAGQEAKKQQESMAAEIEKVKKEYEEKQQKKKERKKKEKESQEAKQKDETNQDADKNKDGTKENAKSDEKERAEKVCFSYDNLVSWMVWADWPGVD